MAIDYKGLADIYQPEVIKVLLVGEAPPHQVTRISI